MAYADYAHCAICDVKLVYVGERDETDESIVCKSCHDLALAAERSRTIEECKADIREYWAGVSEHGLKLVAIIDRLDGLKAKGGKP